MAITYISIERTTGSDVFTNDQSDPPLTEAQADLVAERYMELLVERMQAAYPEATVEVVAGNGLGGGTAFDGGDYREEDDAKVTLGAIADRLWESDEVWSVAS
jgi:hypothetical protein